MTYPTRAMSAVVCALLVAGCAEEIGADNSAAAAAPHITASTCDTIREEVIRIASTNGVNIVKIYNPKTIKTSPTKAVCSGRALVGTGQEAKIYYRNFQDADGDWLVEYSEKRMN